MSKTFTIFLVIVTSIIRVSGNLVLNLLNIGDASNVALWNIFSATATALAWGLLFFYGVSKPRFMTEEAAVTLYFKELNRIMIMTLILFVGKTLLSVFEGNSDQISGFGYVLLSEITGVYTLYCGFRVYNFISRWLLYRRHKKTKAHQVIIQWSVIVLFALEFFSYSVLQGSHAFNIISGVLLICVAFLIFITTRRNSWIAILPRAEKRRLIWLSLFAIIISFFVAGYCSSGDRDVYRAIVSFLPGGSALVVVSYIFLSAYFIRIFVSTLGAMPTANLVEHQMEEIYSLVHLNKVVAETTDLATLFNTVSRLAVNVSGANICWVETYNHNGDVTISSYYGINRDKILALHQFHDITRFFKNLKIPVLIGSLYELPAEYPQDLLRIDFGKSLIAVPLQEGEKKIGTLLMLHNEEFGFEQKNLNVLQAFGDNVSIALENARLLEDSLEKERYRQELLIAKNIEEKLLPQILPPVSGCSIAAFTMPAVVVGGDYYDVVNIKGDRTCILIGDVSGKGMNAAFYMAQLKGVVLAVAKESEGAADILRRINTTLYGSMEKQMYITLSALVVENESGSFTYSRAGHLPLLYRNMDNWTTLLPKGLGIGLAGSEKFDGILEEVSFDLQPPALCLMMTDGLTELQTNIEAGTEYDYLKQILKTKVYTEAEGVISDLKTYVQNTNGDAQQRDDITVFTLVYDGRLR
jgi:serine phosphatase RsbU (regulator of sigma subunit)